MYPYDEADTENSLARLVQDPLYWREQDPEFRAYVDSGFKAVYGNDAAETDATGRTIDPAPKPVALLPFRPTIRPEDAELAGGVGENQPNCWRDVWKVQKGLAGTGHYALDLTKEKSGERSPKLDQAIRDFQREKREEIDDVLLPGGPTIMQLKDSLFGESPSEARPAEKQTSPRMPVMPAGSLIGALNPLLEQSNRPIAPQAQPAAPQVEPESEGAVPAQAPGPAEPPSDPQRRRTHREAEDRSMERNVSYPVIDLPERGSSRNALALVLRGHSDRATSILSDSPGRFMVRENAQYKGREPSHASHNAGVAAVELFDHLIREEAARAGVDPNLIRAIMYVENAQGHYFGAAKAAEGLGLAKSILPMNIRPDIWAGLGFTERDFYNPRTNIRAAALLIRRIHERLDDPTVSKLATLYNLLPRNSVTEYGARVAEVYRSRAWDRFKDK